MDDIKSLQLFGKILLSLDKRKRVTRARGRFLFVLQIKQASDFETEKSRPGLEWNWKDRRDTPHVENANYWGDISLRFLISLFYFHVGFFLFSVSRFFNFTILLKNEKCKSWCVRPETRSMSCLIELDQTHAH